MHGRLPRRVMETERSRSRPKVLKWKEGCTDVSCSAQEKMDLEDSDRPQIPQKPISKAQASNSVCEASTFVVRGKDRFEI